MPDFRDRQAVCDAKCAKTGNETLMSAFRFFDFSALNSRKPGCRLTYSRFLR